MGSRGLPTNGKWRFLGGRLIPCMRTVLLDAKKNNLTFHIGTDSKPFKNFTIVSTAICLREDSKGVIVAYRRKKVKNFHSLAERLMHETTESITVANIVSEVVDCIPVIHSDVNVKESAESTKMMTTISGMVKGMGYEIRLKPNAWAADIADMFTR